jgi:hypothetical protein
VTSENITTSPAPEPAKPFCPACGARRFPNQTTCWLCRKAVPALPQEVEAESSQSFPQTGSNGYEAAWPIVAVLGILLLVGLALTGAYGLLILLAIVGFPALGLAWIAARAEGRGSMSGSNTQTTMGCLGIVALIGLAMFITFFVSCMYVVSRPGWLSH